MAVLGTTRRRVIALVAAIAVVALGGAAAYAYWTAGGTGTGFATTGHSSNFTISSTDPTGGPLSPGGPAETVAFTVHNPATGAENLDNVVVTVAAANGDAWTSGTCSAADFTVDAATITPGTIVGGGDLGGTVTLRMTDTGLNQDDCQNLDNVPLHFQANAAP